MNSNINLKDNERKAFRSYHNDGLIDISLGLVLLLSGIFIGIGSAWWAFVIIALAFPWYYEIKKHVTVPRLGMVHFGRGRKVTQNQKWLLFTVVVMALILIMIVAGYAFLYTVRKDLSGGWHDVIRANFVLLMGTVVALTIAAGGIVFELKRFYLYAALVLASFLSERIINFPEQMLLGLALPGALILAYGILLMARFMRDNPVIMVPECGGECNPVEKC